MHGAVRAASKLRGLNAGAAQSDAHADRALIGEYGKARVNDAAFHVRELVRGDTGRLNALVDGVSVPQIPEFDHERQPSAKQVLVAIL